MKSESVPMDHHSKRLTFTAEINTFAKNSLVSGDNVLHLLTVLDFELQIIKGVDALSDRWVPSQDSPRPRDMHGLPQLHIFGLFVI